MEHSFNVEIAKEFGVNCAIIIRHFQFWIIKNKASDRNLIEGSTWSYGTPESFSKIFPYFSAPQIRRILNKLIELKVLKTGNYNKIAYDRTLWYAFINEDAFIHSENSIVQNGHIHLTKSLNQSDDNGKPIPNTNTDDKPNTKHIKNKYGDHKHVLMTKEENILLFKFHGKELAEEVIYELDCGIHQKAYKYKHHFEMMVPRKNGTIPWPLEEANKTISKRKPKVSLEEKYGD